MKSLERVPTRDGEQLTIVRTKHLTSFSKMKCCDDRDGIFPMSPNRNCKPLFLYRLRRRLRPCQQRITITITILVDRQHHLPSNCTNPLEPTKPPAAGDTTTRWILDKLTKSPVIELRIAAYCMPCWRLYCESPTLLSNYWDWTPHRINCWSNSSFEKIARQVSIRKRPNTICSRRSWRV